MSRSVDDIVLQVLTLAGYRNDKQAFVQKFKAAYEKQAFLNLVTALPLERQIALREEMKGIPPSRVMKLLQRYFSEEAYTRSFEAAAKTVFHQCLSAITPALTPAQQQSLHDYFSPTTTAPQG